jgi:hypothetical protein
VVTCVADRAQRGLIPAQNAPVWQMNQFRERFLQAYGPQC